MLRFVWAVFALSYRWTRGLFNISEPPQLKDEITLQFNLPYVSPAACSGDRHLALHPLHGSPDG